MKITLIVIGSFLIICAAVFFIYVSIYYHADETALKATVSDDKVTVTESNGRLVFAPKKSEYGLIFYPGGKVEYKAYSPLMHKLAEQGILCVVTEMPFNLAIFNTDAADGIAGSFPQIKHWYIGGHSLGGSMAAMYAAKHSDELEGLILLSAYSTEDLSNTGLNVLSIYGSNDKVLNMDKYEANKKNLPEGFHEYVIEGGCHAYFGSYGKQDGDGEPGISPQEQWKQTVEYIIEKTAAGANPTAVFVMKYNC